MLKQAGAIIFIVGITGTPAEAACRVPRFYMIFGSDASASMVTQTGGRCQALLNARMVVSGGSVVRPPAHGTASIDGHHIFYQSRAGYTGPDAFTVAVSGTSYTRGRSGSYALDGTTNLDFSVQVMP